MYVYPGKNSERLSNVYDGGSTVATCRTGPVDPSGAPEITPGFSRLRAAPYLVFCIMLCGSLFFLCLFFLLAIILDVLLRYTAFDSPLGSKET